MFVNLPMYFSVHLTVISQSILLKEHYGFFFLRCSIFKVLLFSLNNFVTFTLVVFHIVFVVVPDRTFAIIRSLSRKVNPFFKLFLIFFRFFSRLCFFAFFGIPCHKMLLLAFMLYLNKVFRFCRIVLSQSHNNKRQPLGCL